MDDIHEVVNGAADDTCLSSVRGKAPPPPADASACCHLLTRTAEGTRSRGEQRAAERREDDGVALLPNPALADWNQGVVRERFSFVCWAKTLLIVSSKEVMNLSVLYRLDKSVVVSQIDQVKSIVWFRVESVKVSRWT